MSASVCSGSMRPGQPGPEAGSAGACDPAGNGCAASADEVSGSELIQLTQKLNDKL